MRFPIRLIGNRHDSYVDDPETLALEVVSKYP